MKISYSSALEVDVDVIYTFCSQLIAGFETDPIDLDKVLPWCKRKISSQLAEYQRILKDGELAGYFHLSPMEDGSWELDDFYLFEGYRGQGIGKKLLNCAFEDATKCVVWTGKENNIAISLYQSSGFVLSGLESVVYRKD